MSSQIDPLKWIFHRIFDRLPTFGDSRNVFNDKESSMKILDMLNDHFDYRSGIVDYDFPLNHTKQEYLELVNIPNISAIEKLLAATYVQASYEWSKIVCKPTSNHISFRDQTCLMVSTVNKRLEFLYRKRFYPIRNDSLWQTICSVYVAYYIFLEHTKYDELKQDVESWIYEFTNVDKSFGQVGQKRLIRKKVKSLQNICKKTILNHTLKRNVSQLPLPTSLHSWICERGDPF